MKPKYRVARATLYVQCFVILIVVVCFVSPLRTYPPASHAQTNDTEAVAVPEGPGLIYTFTNPTPINIPGGPGVGSPYPSEITVSNIPIQLAKVTVRLNSMSHTFPADVDILLVGPGGQTAFVMSDVGGGDDINGVNLVLDDAAAGSLPAAMITSGTYKPTNAQVGDVMPAPAPAASSSSVLSVFNGTNPNGVWKLFVYDDLAVDSGSIGGGWTLSITAAISGQNTGAISIPSSGTASPYPSEINIIDHPNPVSRVLVNLVNFTHSSPDDVDILLVSPSGRAVVLMSDVGGGNAVSNLNLSIDDTATTLLPDSGPLISGTYRPSNYEPGDEFPAPAPSGAPMGATLASLNGTPANGTWRLFVVDDAGNNVGDIAGGWNILIGNSASVISMPGAGVALPYPAEFSVSGMPGNTTKVVATLTGFSHLAPDDVDILLEAPDGRRIVLMSDAGGTSEVGSLNLTFDDAAANAVPDTGPLASGTYRPADYEPGEVFPAPAPSGPPTGTTLGAFYGGVPNGIWKLYVVNESGQSFGSIAGSFSVSVQSSSSACLVTLSPTVQAFPVAGGSSSFNITQPNGCTWTASTLESFITINSGTSGAGNGLVTFTVGPNAGPPRTGSIRVSNGVAVRSFEVQQASGCPFAVSQSTMNFARTGGGGSINVSAGGTCSWQGSTIANWITITSQQPQSGDGTLTFTVEPNTSRVARTASLIVGTQVVTVNQAGVRSALFDFDGDSRTDVSVFRPPTSTWWILSGGVATATQFGISTDRVVAADYDGDLKTDIAVYRDGTWYALKSTDGTVIINSWGTATDKPVPADFDGDGRAQFAVYRPSTGEWWILNSDGTFSSTAFGISTDIPTVGDYDGDGRADLSIYRAGDPGVWWILRSSNSTATNFTFGVSGDIPVPADYDTDGRDNVAVYRPSTGYWYRSLNAAANYDAVQWGVTGDIPAPGDYDGDGRADPAVVRGNVWYLLGSTSGATAVAFGLET